MKKKKPILPEGHADLQAAVLRNGDGRGQGSKFISGFTATNEERLKASAFLRKEGFEVGTNFPDANYNLKTRTEDTNPSPDSVTLYPFRITLPNRAPIDTELFDEKYGVKVHIVSAPDIDMEKAAKTENAARLKLAESVREGLKK